MSVEPAGDARHHRRENRGRRTPDHKAEQELMLDKGLPMRGWFKHALYAPGFYTGYSVKTIPGVRESIEQRNFLQAQTELISAAQAINRFTEYLEKL